MSRMPRFWPIITVLVLFASGAVAQRADPASTQLTTAAEIRALSAERAETHIPVRIRGVVTATEPDWTPKYVVQDETAGVFVQNVGPQPKIGDLIEVVGTTGPGWFAPVIQSNQWTKIGTAPLPEAKIVPIQRLMAGVEASQRIEIEGVVRAVSKVGRKDMLEVAVGGYRVRVFPKLPPTLDPQTLVAAKVRVRGTAASTFNAARRQLTAVLLMVPSEDDLMVEQRELHSPFDQPALPLNDVARFRTNGSLGDRLHVKGVVTLQRRGLDLYLQDATGGLRLESRQPTEVPVGRAIEAAGFLEIVDFQPVLRDVVFRDLSEDIPLAAPVPVPVAELRDGLHGAEVITLTGTLLDRIVRPIRRDDAGFSGVRTIITVRGSEHFFTAEYEGEKVSEWISDAPLGSIISVDGVASLESGDDGKPRSITLLMPRADGIRVVQKPSWFTPRRLFVLLAVALLLFAVTAMWLLTVSKKNAMLRYLIAEREKAQRELQEAHDQLEVRVKERTEQLKFEMTVRKSAEVEFRAILSERTRLARELHDTLEQALTGIALQLDTASKLFQRNPGDALSPLERARGFLKQSQVELRRSIWDLRSRELEQFNLVDALTISSRQMVEGTPIALEIATFGEKVRLPEVVEENLLRIAQEALTNVVKHSGATHVWLRIEFRSDAVRLDVRDNGSGLRQEAPAHGENGHYGLLGMKERAKRLSGKLEVESSPGRGTVISAWIPLDSPEILKELPQNHGVVV